MFCSNAAPPKQKKKKKTTKLFFLLRNGFTWQRVGLPDCWNLCISLSLSLCMHTDRHTQTSLYWFDAWLMQQNCCFEESEEAIAYFIKSLSAGAPHSGTHSHCISTCSFFSLWSNATLLLFHNDVFQCKCHILACREEGNTFELCVCMHTCSIYTCAAYVRILQRSDGIFSFQLHTLSILMNMKARLLKAWWGLGVSY